jgi:ACS family hexuronate transporter-like MFS transporter
MAAMMPWIMLRAWLFVRGLRWWIIGLVFLATLINFIDPTHRGHPGTGDHGPTEAHEPPVSGAYDVVLVAYTASQGVSGKVYDRVGAKRGFTISVLVWSVAASAHAVARGLTDLRVLRVVLGLGEAGNWPGAAKSSVSGFPSASVRSPWGSSTAASRSATSWPFRSSRGCS